MAHIALKTLLSLSLLLLPTIQALPQFWHHGRPSELPFPTLTVTSSAGIYPTGAAGTTGTGTGTGTGTSYYPTATGSSPFQLFKRDTIHPFGFPPPYRPFLDPSIISTGFPTASAPPVLSTYIPIPTGTAPSASGTGTGTPYPSVVREAAEVEAAKQIHRMHFEGPRRDGLRPFYPFVASSVDGNGAPTGTGSGVMPTGTGAVPTGTVGTSAITLTVTVPMPTETGGMVGPSAAV